MRRREPDERVSRPGSHGLPTSPGPVSVQRDGPVTYRSSADPSAQRQKRTLMGLPQWQAIDGTIRRGGGRYDWV
jgi:hypothetical protein